VQFHTVTLADSMIVIARYVSVSNSRNAGMTGVHLPKVVSETEQTKCAIECLKKQQKSK
jgi:hypothetical protein